MTLIERATRFALVQIVSFEGKRNTEMRRAAKKEQELLIEFHARRRAHLHDWSSLPVNEIIRKEDRARLVKRKGA